MRIIDRKEVTRKTGLSRSSIIKLENEGRFPASIPLDCRRKGYSESEVDEWIKSKIKERDEALERDKGE